MPRFESCWVSVPATSANLGPGFDTIGIALDLRLLARIAPSSHFSLVFVHGPHAPSHDGFAEMIRSGILAVCKELPHATVVVNNLIPLGKGLGSSAAAIVLGLRVGAHCSGKKLTPNDFAKLAPKRVTFRIGGLITGLIGIAMMPWKLLADPSGYIFTWLVGYSALLGPIGGIMIADYFVYRRRRLHVHNLYLADGEYHYSGGFSWVAIAALLAGALPSLPGFLVNVNAIDATHVAPLFLSLYSYAWFVGFGVAFVVYLVLRHLAPRS